VGVAYAVLASATRPFTGAADVVTAGPLVVAVAVTVWTIVVGGGARGRPHAAQPVADETGPIRWNRWWCVWLAPLAAATAWELYCFVTLPRVRHPTLSTLIDMLDSTRIGKTVAFTLWLAMGWLLVTR